LTTSARAILRGQMVVTAMALLLAAQFGAAVMFPIAVLAMVGPPIHLWGIRKKRIQECDKQASTFILALANSLKTVPNITAALEGIVPVMRDPIRQEIKLALAEITVGCSVETALLNTSKRAQSKGLDTCISALLVGKQVGGNLSAVLETTASTLREMDRLEGVVRSKTAEGRAQLAVLAAFPLGIALVFNLVCPGYFDPLQQFWSGRIVVGLVMTLWISALLLARAIMMVDI